MAATMKRKSINVIDRLSAVVGLGSAAYTDKGLYGRRVDVPTSASAYGEVGDWAVESGYLYLCVDTDTWQRVAIATWV